MKFHIAFVAGTLACAVAHAAVTVDAGDFDRRDTVVMFKTVAQLENHQLEADGERLPLQLDESGNACFVVPQLRRGEKRTFKLVPLRADLAMSVVAKKTGAALDLSAGNQSVFKYNIAKTEFPPDRADLKPIFHRAAYIHPVLTPGGVQVTDDYPSNHKHHHGIWMSWTGTEFEGRKPDFWNMGDGKGTVEFVALDKTWSGTVHAGFIAKHRYMDLTAPEPKAALNETWTVHLFEAGSKSAKPYYLFDIDVKDECATKTPVKLPEYRYGGLCVRGNWAWNGKGKSFVLTSEGETDAAKGDKNQVHARWVHLGGMVDGKFAGIATLAHPTNFRAPEPIRLNPAEPYFNFAPQQAGDMEITPEKPFNARYRFVVADGKPDRAELDRLWNDYAHPPVVTVSDQ